ncbi:hypothetical protein KIL84_007346, partial [Mauremys mutica]
FTTNTPSGTVNFIPPLTTSPVITSFNPAHNGRVCSTWGNFHFRTFDGDIFYFPGLCNYVFASHCNAAYEDFNIQIRRTMVKNAPTINHITMKLNGVVFEMTKNLVVVNGNRVQLPYSQSGIMAERSSMYTKVTAKIGLVFMWNDDDSILLELSDKYANYTCGLCGDFNGIPTYNEFFSNNAKLTATQFGNMQKMDGPTEVCEDPTSSSLNNCTGNIDDICHKVLTGPAFSECNTQVEVSEYIKSCEQDLCRCDQSENAFCICNTFGEYSRQCAHAGGQPLNWRTPQLCPKTCPFNMEYQECGSPCIDTCTNRERAQVCEDHCIDGCFCPAGNFFLHVGTVLDDINNAGCIPLLECSCTYNGNSYAPGTSFDAHCRSCTCNGGLWNCKDIPCPGSCTVEGGSHISTYDEKRYNVHGDCIYVLSKLCENDTFAVLGELRRCGLTVTETCLKAILLSINGGQTIITINSGGGVFVNWIYTLLPFSAANVTIFRPSSFFIMVETNFGLQLEIQLVPIMQAFVRLDPSFKGQTCGLCGNFNDIGADDFKAMSGVVEGTTAAFANTWRSQASCPTIENYFENPCALSVENEKYAQHWCGLLMDSTGPFANCHSTVNPAVYHTNCLFDTCNCEKSEDCMCAALSSYVRACAAKGVQLEGWRTDVCSKYTTLCPKSLSYSYNISSCQPTCRSLSEPDVTCNIRFLPVDGCTCEKGTYMDEYGKCVSASKCPCYYKGSPMLSGEVVHEDGLICTCAQGRLSCIGAVNQIPVCAPPMVYFDCRNVTAGTTGAECQKSCQTLDMQCYSTQCMSGCICPSGLVSDGKGSCIVEEECPCIHNEATYKPGEEIKVDCNTCVCKNRMWKCTSEQCLGTCAVYGDGHYITFDDKWFNFNGDCEYTLVQDHCGKNSTVNGTFRVVTENIPCGSTGTTCSKSIKVFLAGYELILSEEHLEVVERENGRQMPYQVRYMGMYLVIETNNGLILMWDKKTSIFIKLSPDFKGQVCGLCGNYDGNGINDFTTRSQSVVGDVLEFGNSWKVSLTCPVANSTKDPCSTNPYRKSWSQRQCSIINSEVFAACHSQIEPTKYYEACVTDACACDSGGDCECFCTAVAAYAQACSEFGVCVAWRTPSICPMFCDYYNPEGGCEWHYKPCGAPCMKTCRNPSGRCLHKLPGLEGCYPNCPANKPYFNEDEMTCVDNCGCYDAEGNYHKPGVSFYSWDNCQSCTCTVEGLECKYDAEACYCYYEEHKYKYKDVIYNTTDGIGGCLSATCDINGTITRKFFECSGITTTIPFTFSTVLPTSAAGTTTTPPVTTVCVHNVCQWSQWYDIRSPTTDNNNGDFETFEKIKANGYGVCETPNDVECRAEPNSSIQIKDLKQKITCSKDFGLICNNEDQSPENCYNYQIRILCCTYVPCESSTSTPPVKTSGHPTVTATSLESKPVLNPTASISTEGPTPFPLATTSSVTTTLVPPVSITLSVTSTASPPTPGTATGSAGTASLQTGTIPPVKGMRPQPSPGSTLPSSEQPTTEGTTLPSTQPISEGSTTTIVPPVSTTVSVTSTASPPTPATATGSAGTASLQTGTIPPLTGTRPQPSPGSTLPSSEQTTTEGTTLLSTQPKPKGSTTTLLPPVSTTMSVTSTASPPTPGTATGSAGTAPLPTGTIPPLTGTGPQPSPGSTLPPLGQTTTEGTTLISTQPASQGSTTTLLPPVSTTISVTSTSSPPTPGTATGSAGTASLQTGTIPHVTSMRPQPSPASTLPSSEQPTTEGTTLLSTQPTAQGSTTTLLPPVSTAVSVTSTASPPTLGTATGSALTASLQTGTIPHVTSTRPQSSPGSTLPPLGKTTTEGTTVLSTQPISEGSTTTLLPPVSTTMSVTSTASPPTPGTATGSASTASLQTGTIPPVKGMRPQPSPGSTLPSSEQPTTEGTTLLSTQPTPQGSTTMLVPPVSTTVSVTSTASPPTPGTATGSAGTASLQTGTIPHVTSTRPQSSPGSTLPPLGKTTTVGTTLLSTQPISEGSTTTLVPPVSTTVSVTSTASPPTPATATGSAGTAPLPTGTIPSLTGTRPQSSPGSTLPSSEQPTTEGTTLPSTQPISEGGTTTLVTPVSTTMSVTSTASPPTPGTATGSAGTASLQTGTIPPLTGTRPQPSPGSTLPSSEQTTTEGTTLLSTQPISKGSTTTLLPPVSTTMSVTSTASPPTPGTATGSAGTAPLPTGTIPPLTGTGPQPSPGSTLPPLGQTTTEGTTLLSTQPTSQGSTTTLLPPVSTTVSVTSTASPPTPGTATGSAGTASLQTGTIPHVTSTRPQSSPGSTLPPLGKTTTEGTTLLSTQPISEGSTTTLVPPVSTTVSVTSTASPPTPATATGSAGTASLQTGTIPPLTGTRPQPSPGSTLPSSEQTTTEGTTLLATQPISKGSTTTLLPPVSTTMSVTSTASPPTPGTATGSAGTAPLPTGTIPPLTGTGPQPSPGSTLPPLGQTTTEGTTLISTQPASQGSTTTLLPPVSTTISVTSTSSPPTPGTATGSAGTASLQTGTIPHVTSTRPQSSPGSTLPPLGKTTTEGTTLLSTQPISEGSTTTLVPPVSTTVSVTSTASPPTPGTATGSAGTASLQTGTIPHVTSTRPQSSPGSTLPSSEQPTTEGTTLLSTQPTSEGSTTTLVPPVSTTVSVTSTASPPTPATATGSAGTASLQTGTIPPLTGTRPQPSPGSTLPSSEQTTTEGTTLLSTQPISKGSTTTLLPPVSTTMSVTSTASLPTPGTATGSAGTAPLPTGTIPPLTGTGPQPSPGSTLPPLGQTTTEGTTLLSTQPTSQRSTTMLLPPVSTTISVTSTSSAPTPGTATGSAGTASLQTGTIPHVTSTRPQSSPGSTLPPLGKTTTEGTTLLSTQPISEGSTTTLVPPVSTTVSVTSTASPPTPGTATGSAGTASLQTGRIPPLIGTRPQPSPGSTLPPLGKTTTEGTTLLSTQPISEGSTTTLVPPVSTTVSVTSTASPPTPATATGSAGTAPLPTGTIPSLTGTRPQSSPGSTLPSSEQPTTEGTTLPSTQPISEGSTTTLVPPVSTTMSVTSTASPPTPGRATGSAGTASLQTGTIPPLTGTRPQPSPGSTLPSSEQTTTEGTTLLSTQPISKGSTTTLLPPVSTTMSVTSTASLPTPGTATGSAGTAPLPTGTIPPLTGTGPQPSPGSTLPPLGQTTTEGTTLLSTQPTSQGSTTTLLPPVSTTISVTSTSSAPTPGTATGSAGTASLQTGTIPHVTSTRPQSSPGSTLPPLGKTTTEGTTLLSTQPISEGSTTTLVPPVSTTVSVTSTASPPTPGTATGSAGTASLQTGRIPPLIGTRPQPSPGSTLPSSEQTTTEGTTLPSTQPISEGSTTTIVPPVSTTVSVTSTASPPTPATATGSAGTASLQTGTIPPLTGTRPQPSPGSTLPSSEQTTTEGTTLLSTQPISKGSTTTLLPPVSTTMSVTSTASPPTPGTATGSAGTAPLPTGTIPPLTGTGTTLISTQPASQGSTTTLLPPVSTTISVTSTSSPPTPGTATGSAGTASLQTGTIPHVTSTRPQSSPGSTLPPLGKTTTVGTTLLSTQPTSEGSTTTLVPPVSTTVSVTSTASPPTPATATGSAGTASLQTGTIPPLTGTRPQPSPGSTLPSSEQTTTEGTTLLSTQPISKGSTTTLLPPVSTTMSVTSTASPPTPGTATGSAGTAPLPTGTIPPLTGTGPQPSPGSTLPPLGKTTTEGTTLLSMQPTSQGSTTVSVTSTASPPTPGRATGSAGTAPLQTGTIPPVTGTRGEMITGSASTGKSSTITGSTMLLFTSPVQSTSQGSTTTILSPVSSTVAVSPTLSIRTPEKSTISRLTSSVSARTEGPSIAYTAHEKSTSFTSSRVTPCLCHVSGDFFSPGEVIYNRTDSTGCSFYALCSKRCEIERLQGSCPTTALVSLSPSSTIPSLSTPTALSSSVSATPETIPISGCPDADPPRKMNESWMLNNCTMATCEGDNRIVLLLPPAVEMITCASGLPPIKVYDEDGCNYHYECDCVCSGWSSSDYLTFDGTHYTFHGNCTYVLMKQIVPKYNFSILVENDFCDVPDGLSCPRSIIVNYNSMEIVLVSQIHQGEKNNKILVNNEPISGGFSRDGISVANDGTYMVVEIPDIKSYISFNGLTFTVKMPFSMFGHNTEGQCGTCSNDKVDECRMPSGKVISSCSEMAAAWQVQDENKPNCEGPPVPPATPTTPPVPCNSTSPLCELILSDLFAECHKILMPSIFYESCVAKSCHITNESIPCFSLEMYASLCSAKGACADWRSKTQGQCPYNCPNGKVYDACGPLNPVTCNSGTVYHTSEHVAEGCFCPKDKILFNSYTDVCVSECACVGPDGMPKLPGAIWKSNCQECVCDPFSVTVQCKSLTCQTPETHVCEKEGFIPVPVLTPEDPCCPEIECRCNTNACSQAKKTCEPGYQLATILSEGDCCVNYTCGKFAQTECALFGFSQAGTSVPMDSCKTCTCSSEVDPVSNRNLLQCELVRCDTTCPLGYQYMMKDGKCCGECVQVACTIKLTNNTVQVLKPGDIWKPEDNPCSFYKCEQIEDQLVSVTVVRTCPAFEPENCKPDDVQLTADGCCKTCTSESANCKVNKNSTVIRHNECESSEPIELTYCKGVCASSSTYSFETQQMQHKCSCCQELKSHKREVTLTCSNGTNMNYDYVYVEQCQCMTGCISETTTTQQLQQEEEQKRTR